MRALIRILQAAVVGLLFALPAISDDVVGGGGDSGVWILPNVQDLGALPNTGSVTTLSGPRATRVLPTVTSSLIMQMPPAMGAPIAVLNEIPSYARLPLLVSGNRVTIPMATLKHVRDSVSGRADGWMVDVNGRGFLMRVRRGTTNQEVRVEIY